ncbi:CotH kinase family protein [Pseudonocardia pini]|uniref:CotH kinase family protein n=1 Tax=Pseudonocardia pini TaxID=2758030 RepID=UPI0015F0B7D7|nr:CotH kinase family protein [Pseudonocardia pini]
MGYTAADLDADLTDRALCAVDLAPGRARTLLEKVATDGVHRGREREALFGVLVAEFGGPELDLAGPAGEVVEAYRTAALTVDDVFAEPLLGVHVRGFGRQELPHPKTREVAAPAGATLEVGRLDPTDTRHVPPADALYRRGGFELECTGNRTLAEPKSSWRARLDARFAGLERLHLKSMVNDASVVREAVAWSAFAAAGIRCSRRTYARYAMDGTYRGLYSLTEDVHTDFLRRHFGSDAGQLYKASCGDVDRGGFGCATLAPRGPSGADYRPPAGAADPTYELRSGADTSFDDLARFVQVLHGGDFASAGYRDAMEEVFAVRAFLRWAGVTVLLGSWDTYYGTPANYFLYNSRTADRPFFTFLPWDHDNVLGITYDLTQQAYDHADWAGGDVLDWPPRSLPLLGNLLQNPDLRQYYLDHLAHLLETTFDPETVAATADAAWQTAQRSAYLESHTPHGTPFTGRRWANHDMFRHNEGEDLRYEFPNDDRRTLQAVTAFARRRHETAWAQLRNHQRHTRTFEPLP